MQLKSVIRVHFIHDALKEGHGEAETLGCFFHASDVESGRSGGRMGPTWSTADSLLDASFKSIDR